MQHPRQLLRTIGRRRRGRARTALAALAALVAAAAPAAAMQADSGITARRAPASTAESSVVRPATRPDGARALPVVDGAAEPVAPRVTLAPVSVRATRLGAAASVLRGSAWRGDYTAPGSARRADLAITVGPAAEGADAVSGEVALRVRRGGDVFDDGDVATETLVTVPIVGATASGGEVQLVTAPFVDPACGCTVTGTFAGTVRGDAVDGRFTLRGADTSAPRRGRWRAARVPVSPEPGSATSPDE